VTKNIFFVLRKNGMSLSGAVDIHRTSSDNFLRFDQDFYVSPW